MSDRGIFAESRARLLVWTLLGLFALGTAHFLFPKDAAVIGATMVLLLGFVAFTLLRNVESRVSMLATKVARLVPDANLRSDEPLATLSSALTSVEDSLSRAGETLEHQQIVSLRILHAMREGVLVLDAENRIALVNPAVREMLLIGQESVGMSLMHAIRHAELRDAIAEAEEGRVKSIELELGGLRPRRLEARVIELQKNPRETLVVFVDVTDMRRLENMRREFVANVSHELRTPLTSMLSASETLSAALRMSPEKALPFVDIIERNGARLEALVEDLLDLSRMESKAYRFTFERVRILPLLEQIETLLRDKALKRRIQIRVTAAADLEHVTDRRALERVLTNLIENGVKYGKDDGAVVVTASHADELLQIEVSDNGPGIPSEHLPRLFERFYRVDAGRARDVGGTGLGLSIAKHLVEAMGGEITVESDFGKGTLFRIALPEVSMPSGLVRSSSRT